MKIGNQTIEATCSDCGEAIYIRVLLHAMAGTRNGREVVVYVDPEIVSLHGCEHADDYNQKMREV